jgi:hypothetical protein
MPAGHAADHGERTGEVQLSAVCGQQKCPTATTTASASASDNPVAILTRLSGLPRDIQVGIDMDVTLSK